MNAAAGFGLIAGGAVAGVLTAFFLWDRAAPALGPAFAAASGGVVGAGAILVQAHATVGDWLLAVLALMTLTPLHLRALFGSPGGHQGG